jgi:hypothetical protein
MPNDTNSTALTVENIRALVQSLRRGGHYYEDGHYISVISPHHLETPEARGRLWQMMARLVELEQQDKER